MRVNETLFVEMLESFGNSLKDVAAALINAHRFDFVVRT